MTGDRHFYDSNGERRWGAHGAAGAVVYCAGHALDLSLRDEVRTSVLLVRRAGFLSTEPGKWSFPSGAHVTREDAGRPGVTAWRELAEETGISPVDVRHKTSMTVELASDWSFEYALFEYLGARNERLELEPELDGYVWGTVDYVWDKYHLGELHKDITEEVLTRLFALLPD